MCVCVCVRGEGRGVSSQERGKNKVPSVKVPTETPERIRLGLKKTLKWVEPCDRMLIGQLCAG